MRTSTMFTVAVFLAGCPSASINLSDVENRLAASTGRWLDSPPDGVCTEAGGSLTTEADFTQVALCFPAHNWELGPPCGLVEPEFLLVRLTFPVDTCDGVIDMTAEPAHVDWVLSDVGGDAAVIDGVIAGTLRFNSCRSAETGTRLLGSTGFVCADGEPDPRELALGHLSFRFPGN